MARFKVKYWVGKQPGSSSYMSKAGNHFDNVVYTMGPEEVDFGTLEQAEAFYHRLEHTWETEEKLTKDRTTPHVIKIELQQGNESSFFWKTIKSADYDTWYKANKDKWLEKPEDDDSEPAGVLQENTKKQENMKKQIRITESELRKTVSKATRKFLKEMMETVQPGSVSHGTMRPADLIPLFMGILQKEAPQKAQEILDNYPLLDIALTEYEDGNNSPYFESEEATEVLNNEIWDAMNSIAPEGHYFGSHPGDGSDYGYWEDDENLYENRLKKIVAESVKKILKEHAWASASTFKELQIVLDKVTGILRKFSNNIPQEHSDEFMKLVGREWNALWESLSSIEETVMHINNPRGLSDGDLTFDDLS